jgi:hypothetical protein
MGVCFDSAHCQYKFLGLYDEEAEGVGTPNMGFNVF